MGTRGITQVINEDSEIIVAQYGQWDHYPEGQGINILSFLTSKYNMVNTLKDSTFKCYWASQEELENASKPFVNEDGWMTMEDGAKFSSMYPSLTRDTGSDILKVIVYSTGRVPLVNQSDFVKDELFCEGVYTINFATNEFISQFGGKTVTYKLDNLPTNEAYLDEFAKQFAEEEVTA